MNKELLHLISKHTEILSEQTETGHQETLEFKTDKHLRTFSFPPPINLSEVDKWLLGVISFEFKNSVFIITNKNNSFSITLPSHGNFESAEKTIDELIK